MSVVVYDCLFVQTLRPQNESRFSIGAQRHRPTDDAIPGDVDRRKVYPTGPSGRRCESPVAACLDCKAQSSETCCPDKASFIQRSLQWLHAGNGYSRPHLRTPQA